MSNTGILSNAIFQEFHGPVNGGALCVDNIAFVITCCYFSENSCQKYGGSVYFTNTNLTLKKSTFDHCWSTAFTSNIYANAVYQEASQAIIENTIIVMCSYSRDEMKCSDSSLFIQDSLTTISYLNSSYNYGIFGGAGFALLNPKENTLAKYVNVISGKDESMIQAIEKGYTVLKANVIDCKECTDFIFFQSTPNLLTLTECIIYDTGDILYTYEEFSIIAFDTYSDREFYDIKTLQQFSSHEINLNMNCRLFDSDILKPSLLLSILSIKSSLMMFLLKK